MIRLTFKLNGEEANVENNRTTYILKYPCSSYIECYPYISILPPGQYLLELWGAQGGSDTDRLGGKGGYSRGILRINKRTEAFFYVGSVGITSTELGAFTGKAFNGGGSGKNDNSHNKGTSGGGGTDIRLIQNSLYHRVIVAGGGGGSSSSYNQCYGGPEGGEIGTAGTRCYPEHESGTGGTQTQGGITTTGGINGIFGYGGDRTLTDGCGGGGGWFGGGAGSHYLNAGGGGSGFIFSEETKYIAEINNISLPDSLFLEESITISGSSSFYSPYSPNNETGHSGSGVIFVTPISFSNDLSCYASNYSYFIIIFTYFISIMG